MARPAPHAPTGLVVWRNRPPTPPVAITTREAGRRTGFPSRWASTPQTRLSATSRRRAATPSSTVTEGVAATATARARTISRPVPSPRAWTMRRRLCAASRPSCNLPAASRSKRTPWRASTRITSGPASTMRRAAAGSHRPAPAARVSASCSSVSSSSPTAAAIPPCAQALEDNAPSGPAVSRVTGCGARCSAVSMPARPAPTITTGFGWVMVQESLVILRAFFRPKGALARRWPGRW